jgi:hypothetical protein
MRRHAVPSGVAQALPVLEGLPVSKAVFDHPDRALAPLKQCGLKPRHQGNGVVRHQQGCAVTLRVETEIRLAGSPQPPSYGSGLLQHRELVRRYAHTVGGIKPNHTQTAPGRGQHFRCGSGIVVDVTLPLCPQRPKAPPMTVKLAKRLGRCGSSRKARARLVRGPMAARCRSGQRALAASKAWSAGATCRGEVGEGSSLATPPSPSPP